MKEITQKWLYDCLGLSIKMENLGTEMKDGVLLAKILKNYDVVNEKTIKNLVRSDNPVVCKNNLRKLNIWFKLLKINVSNDTFNEIANGKTTTCLHILYELYLTLHNQERLHFINTESHKECLKYQTNIDEEYLNKSVSESLKLTKDKKSICDYITYTDNTSKLYSYGIKHKELCTETKRVAGSKIKHETQSKLQNNKKGLKKAENEDIAFVQNELKFTSLPLINKTGQKVEAVQNRICDPFKHTTNECENLIMNSVWKAIENRDKHQFKKEMIQNLLKQSENEKILSANKFQKYLEEKVNHEIFLETKQKIDEDCKNLTFFSSCKTSEEEINSQLEMIEKIEMHKKLYSEKLKKRYKKHYALCLKIISDMVDLAIKKSSMGKEYVNHVIWLEWKQMFLHEQPILDLSKDELNKTKKVSVIKTNISKQPPLEQYFEEYLHLVGPWTEHAGSNVIFDEQNTLGNIIHRLFQIKYPPPFMQTPADIPKYNVCAVLNGFNDELELTKLKALLIKSRLCLIDLKSTINSCIKCYKKEAGIEDEVPSNKKGKKTVTTSERKSNDSKSKKGSNKAPGAKVPIQINVETQTTSSLTSVTKVTELSSKAKLGKFLYDLESLDNLSTATIAEILIEFLKCQLNIKGWLLVNFPSTLKEAFFIEKFLSGKNFPKTFHQIQAQDKKQRKSTASEKSEESAELSNNYQVKYSRLVQFPPNESDNFKTYFTSFILVTDSKTEQSNEIAHQDESTDNNEGVQQQTNVEFTKKNELTKLKTIYEEQGILKEFIYNPTEINSVKSLARLIIKDLSSAEEVPSTELFGEEVLQFLVQTSDQKNKKSPKKPKDDPAVAYEVLIQKHLLNEKKSESETDIDEKVQEILESDSIIKPEQKGWIYTEFYIPENKAINLTGLWENTEESYINKVINVLKKKMDHENVSSLYESFVKETMNELLLFENEESLNVLKNFIHNFNNAIGTRFNEKNIEELGPTILKLEIKLWEISKNRKNKAEKKLNNLVKQNWTAEEMIEIANNFLSLLQIETDRCISTIYIIHNYYLSMSESSSIDLNLHLSLPKISFNEESTEKFRFKSTILKILLDESNINLVNPIHNTIQDVFKKFQTEINVLKFNTIMVIENHEEQVIKKIKEYKENLKTKRKKKSNDDNTPMLAEAKYTEIKNMFLEWSYAVKTECDRTKCRMKIITSKTNKDIEKLEKAMITLFHNIYNEIKSNYLRQNKHIDQICQIFREALKQNKVVPPQALFNENYSNSEANQFIEIPNQTKPTEFEDNIILQCFTVEQLKYISDRLKIISPTGIIHKKSLIYIIEDLMYCEQEKLNIQIFPRIWNEMNSVRSEKLYKIVFGLSDLVDWKDFIIYSLELQFPDMEDIIDYKIRFGSVDDKNNGTISYKDYMNIKLWFEESTKSISQKNHIQAAKQLLFSLFQINESDMNYKELILKFCKDFNPKIGFGKGLAYFLGQCVVASENLLHLENILIDHEELLQIMVEQIMKQIIFDVVHNSAGLIIEELNENLGEQIQTVENVQQLQVNDYSLSNKSEENLLQNTINDYSTEDEKEEEINDVFHNEEDPMTSSIAKNQDINLNQNRSSQTIPFSELLYDEYIKINKIYQWTSRVPKAVINALLEETVYSVLSSEFYEKETKELCQKLRSAYSDSDDEVVYLPQIMEQDIMQDLFSYIHTFKIFSFPAIINEICECPFS